MTRGKKVSKHPKLDYTMEHIHKALTTMDFDFVMVIEGYERTGKSTLALDIAQEIDPTFDVNQIVFDIKEFNKLVWSLDKGKVVIIDEGATALFSRDAMTTDTREGVKILTTMGARNLFVIICVPNFFILDKYIREHRVRGLVRVLSRGSFKYYSKTKLEQTTFNAKLNKTNWADPNFSEHFGKVSGKLWKSYEDRKMSYLVKRSEVFNEEETVSDTHMNTIEAAKQLGITTRALQQRCWKGQVEGALKTDKSWLVPNIYVETHIPKHIGNNRDVRVSTDQLVATRVKAKDFTDEGLMERRSKVKEAKRGKL